MSEHSLDRWTRGDVAFPIVISGPSGAGKTSLVDLLLQSDARCTRSISATTRPPRRDEVDGVNYFFVDEERFLQLRGRGELAESAMYLDHWYGTPKTFLESKLGTGLSVVLNIEVLGGLQVKSHDPESVLIFVVPPTWEDVRHRLTSRGTDTLVAIEERIRRGREELEMISRYDYVVVNDDLERCAADVAAIIRAERRRRTRLERV
jgi:guanylate kinase